MKDHISSVRPKTLPKPAGFSYGYEVKSGRLVFVAGQVAANAEGKIVGGGDLVAQFRQTCANLQAVVAAAGGGMDDFVKLTIYVLDVAEYKKQLKPIGDVYREYFGRHFPAMTLVGARDLFDAAEGALIEIEGVAALA
ncbi:MAG TPA: RidA family protein [Methylomirabilota bacterium]|jgi:enamine deaminase RidA (YjgF/YER057c/UK114 family)|nr:RidA family protein [Methylomirabilota bacterium]